MPFRRKPRFGPYTTADGLGFDCMWSPPPVPGNPTAPLTVPVTNYYMSFGDNYAIVPLSGNNPWETPSPPPQGTTQRIGWHGFWGTTGVITAASFGDVEGGMRGFADYRTMTTTGIAGVTDGTSNTILCGEGLPEQDWNSCVWDPTGASMGVTLPINLVTSGAGNGNFTCRGSYAAKGFKSKHPGGANFLFADGSVKFLKSTLNRYTYAALGSRAGGEIVSSDSY